MRYRASLRRVARNLPWGVFWRLEATSNDLDLNFDRSSIELSRFLSPNIGDLQQKKRYPPKLRRFFGPNLRNLKKKKKRKKIFSQAETQFFCSKSHLILGQLSSPIQLGGDYFRFSAKIGLKSAKNGVFCVLFRQMGAIAPPPPPRLPTGCTTGVTTKGNRLRKSCAFCNGLVKNSAFHVLFRLVIIV